MTAEFRDKFDRTDGEIGADFTVQCGNSTIFDESVLPVTTGAGNSGLSPQLEGETDEKTQVLYTQELMDSRDQVVRCIWSHDSEILGERPLSDLLTLTESDARFTILARMSQDPMLVDLGRDQDPNCFDQGYGLRVTCPRAGGLPTLAIVKMMPPALPPGIGRPSSTEPDGAVVLASVTMQSKNLILDPDWDETGNAPYQGFVQESRLRIRRADSKVILEAFLNDRNMITPILEYTDQQDPLWGVTGRPGFEFLSPRLVTQPGGVSPYQLSALPVMRCHLFEVQTIKDIHRPASVAPSNQKTYDRVIDRVITLVEKDGDAQYNATGAGSQRRATYLQFVVEAESHIIREVGYFEWLRRTANVYLADGRDEYDLPADVGLINFIRPSWNQRPLQEALDSMFHNRLAGVTRQGGRPTIYRMAESIVDDRPRIQVFPVPTVEDGQQTADDHLIVEYFARQLYPSDPDIQIPLVPQEHMDVLIYGAASHALLLDQDDANAQRMAQTFASKLMGLKRDAHRKVSGRQTVMRSAADVHLPNVNTRIPLLRSTQLETLLVF